MILTRMAQAIKQQDWFQVIIEILIVVIGIFLGLQVTEWNDGREAKIAEGRLVSFLIADLENNNSALERIEGFYQQNVDANLWSLDLLQNSELNDENRARFERGLSRPTATSAIDTYLVSFEQGSLDGILSPTMRRSLANYMSEIKDSNMILGNARTSINSLSGILRSSAIVSIESETQPIIDYNFETLKNNEQYRIAFKSIVSRVQVFQRHNAGILEKSRVMLDALRDYQAGEETGEVTFR